MRRVKMELALYARVSKKEQNPEMQIKALIEKAKREGWKYTLFEEKESTRKTRPVKYALYQRLLNKEYDGVCVWKLDRWGRSVQELAREITTLYNKDIIFVSLTDNIDLSSASGRFQFHVFCAMAEFERALISERTIEGLKHAKNVGKRGKDKGRRKRSGYHLRWGKQRDPLQTIDIVQ